MAKVASFFRRLLASITSDDDTTLPSTPEPEPRKSVLIISPPSTKSSSPIIISNTNTSHSCSTSPRISPHSIAKNPILETNINVTNSNYLSSNTHKMINRRLSAPLIIHASTHSNNYRSVLGSESAEAALISPLHRLSLSTSPATIANAQQTTTSANSLSTNMMDTNLTTRPDGRSASLGLSPSSSIILPTSFSTNQVKTGSPVTGTPPLQSVAGASSSSPRVSIQSNNSPSPNSGMKDISPAPELSSNDRKMSLPSRGRRPSMFDPIDPKELQQALYASARASIPLCPAKDDEPARAISRISLGYDRDSEHLSIDSLCFENLHTLDGFANTNNTNHQWSSSNSASGGGQDSAAFYCRFRLWPERRSLFQTKIIRHSRLVSSHLFDEKQLRGFDLKHDQLNNHSIEILVYTVGTARPLFKDVRIATVKYDLSELSESEKIRIKKPLNESDPAAMIQDPDLGELLVSLSYLQSAAKLAVVVIEGKNLRPLSIENKPFPEACVKVTLLDRNGRKIKRKKTSVQRASDCPTFNEELVFELRRDVAAETTIELRVVHESLSYKEQLGSVTFGPLLLNNNNIVKTSPTQENLYWSTVLGGESINAQWQLLKSPIRSDEYK